jgi:Tol biopolymer transport system component
MNADGSDQHTVSAEPGSEFLYFFPWSQDSSRVAVPVPMVGTNTTIITVRADGTDRQDLTDGTTPDTVPTWSPDGEWIAFVRRIGGTRHLMIMRPDGSDQTSLYEPLAVSAGSPLFRPPP